MAKKQFYSRGKLLLTGEYAVLHGAKAIAAPTHKGQSLTVTTGRGSDIIWKSLDEKGNEWFSAKISLFDFEPLKTSDEEIAAQLGDLLQSAVRLNSEFLSTWKGVKVQTRLEFPRNWGWGSSATLVNNVAAWADVDPYELQDHTFGGSGYDLACAMSKEPIIYKRDKEEGPVYSKVNMPSTVLGHMHFFYTGNKKSTSEALDYSKSVPMKEGVIKEINNISESLLNESSQKVWIEKLHRHNQLLSEYLKLEDPKDQFSDFEGVIKPLGAWGGDFMMALSSSGSDDVVSYLREKGFEEIFPASEVIMQKGVAIPSS